jgi:diguanylate cyclase (GGDEF)-like protein/PAS domain S-box-containing protein
MNPLLKYQLYTIGYDGKLDELQTVALLDAVNKAYDKADEERVFWEKMLSASSKGTKQTYQFFKDEFLNKLALTEKKYRNLLLNLQPYYFFYTKNNEGRLTSISDAVVGMLGFTQEEFIERYGKDFMYGLRCDLESKLLISEYGYNIPYEMSIHDKEGMPRYIEITEFPIFNDRHELVEIEGIVRDITEHYKVKNKMSNMLYYDTLTGISNRLHLEVLMEKLLLDNYRNKSHFAVLFLDLDHFKHINDTLGHDVGDILLQKIAESIKESLNTHDIFARIGGDEFVIVLRNIEDIDLTAKVHELMELIRQPWMVKGYELNVSVSIGVALYPQDGKSIVDLMKNADIAMYKSKASGRDNFTFFEEHFNSHVHREMNLIQDMSEAIENDEFLFHFQPKVLLSSNEMISAEALIRWNHPKMGMIYPDRFINLAENTGLILKLGRWVISEACRSIAWFNKLIPAKKFNLSINISIRQFQHEDMYQILKDAIDQYGIDPSQLSIEITESIMMENNEDMAQKLNRIKSLNVGISLDDFGTGYSTLSYLDKLSIDELKIDKAFIDAIPQDGEKNILLDTIIAMGKTLNMTVVAEGVEHEYQRKYLEKKLCDIYQGYLFSKPVSKQECMRYFKASSAMLR